MVSVVQKLLSTKAGSFLGSISYAVYLIHIPVLFSLTAVLFVKMQGLFKTYHAACLVAFVVSLLVIILLAWLFHKFVEKPCIRFTNWLVEQILK